MFNNQAFYHSHIRNAVIAFGTIFNNIEIQRVDSNGVIQQNLRVPISYAPKQKTIQRETEVGDLDSGRAKYEITLPRMAFEITSLNYDSSRKLITTQRVRNINPDNTQNTAFVSTPYNLGMTLSIFAKNQDDGFQIIEQILPYFNPDLCVTINEIPEIGVKRDIQFVLDSVNYNDEYTGTADDRVLITWELNFTVKINFFGYVQRANIIKTVIENVYIDNQLNTTGVPANNDVGEKITITTDPANASPEGPYTFIDQFDKLF